ncbi:MAG: M48 family metalloprotease [Desulfosalsimonadaceae bacterium]
MHSFCKITALAMACFYFFCASAVPAASALTIQEEKDLGKEFLQSVRQRYKIIEDPAVADYINKIGRRVVAELPPQPFEYHFYVIEQDTYNAFAGPAAHIFVYSGLFEALSNEGELAALLSHEIAHVSCRHISKMIEASRKTNIATLAGLIAGMLIGLGGASSVGSAVTMGSMAAGQSATLAYTRENEMQADQFGRRYLQQAGYNLHSMLSLLKTIRSREWYSTKEIPTYLRTHPATKDRLTYLSTELSDQPAPPLKTSRAFERARIRLKALSGDTEQALKHFRTKIRRQPENAMAHYGYALALERSGAPRDAEEHMQIARAAYPEDPYMTEDLGRIYFFTGDFKKALEMLSEATEKPENGPEGWYYLGRTQLALKKPASARKTFSRLVEMYPDYLPGLYFLGKSYAEQEDPGNAHYHLGLYHLGRQDPEIAAYHLEKALKHLTDKEKAEKARQLLEKNSHSPRAPEQPGPRDSGGKKTGP